MSALDPQHGPQYIAGWRDGLSDSNDQAMSVLTDDADPAYRRGYREGWKAGIDHPLQTVSRCAVCGGLWNPGTTDHTRCMNNGYEGL